MVCDSDSTASINAYCFGYDGSSVKIISVRKNDLVIQNQMQIQTMTALPGPDLHAKSFNGEFAIGYGI